MTIALYKSFYDHIDLGTYRSILCLNGDLPEASFFMSALPIIAVDGALNTLVSRHIKPQAVIGDLDGALKENLSGLTVIQEIDQSRSDFQKALAYLQKENLLPCIILGCGGGYLDHILNNINIFLQSDNILFAPPIVGYSLKEGQTKKLSIPLNTKISLMGFPQAQVSSQGLKWELDHAQFTFPGTNSCFNRSIYEEASITVHKGSLLILVYLSFIADAGINTPSSGQN